MRKILSSITQVEGTIGKCSLIIASASIVVMLIVEVLNSFGRKFLIPFPCTVETAEAVLIPAVFLGAAYVALREEHTYVTLMTRKLRPPIKRLIDSFAQLIGASAFTFLAVGAWFSAVESVRKMEIIIGVYSFPVWPFRLLFAIGLSLLSLHLYMNFIKFIFQALDPNWVPKGE